MEKIMSKIVTAFESYCINDSTKNKAQLKIMCKLISRDIELSKKNLDGLTAVQVAAKKCDLELLKLLKKAKADFSVCTEDGDTLLILACKNMPSSIGGSQQRELVKLLVNQGCDVNARNKDGYSALHIAAQWCGVKVVKQLIKLGADVTCCTDKRKLTPLHAAAIFGVPGMVNVLIKAGADINAESVNGITPLHLAALTSSVVLYIHQVSSDAKLINDHYYSLPSENFPIYVHQTQKQIFKFLMSKGNKNVLPSNSGVAHFIRTLDRFEFVKNLIKNGANIHCRDETGRTPSHLVASKFLGVYEEDLCDKKLPDERTLLIVKKNSAEPVRQKKVVSKDIYFSTIEELLHKTGAHADIFDNVNSPFFIVSERRCIDFLECLKELKHRVSCSKETSKMAKYSSRMRYDHIDVRIYLWRQILRATMEAVLPKNFNQNHIVKFKESLPDYYHECFPELVHISKIPDDPSSWSYSDSRWLRFLFEVPKNKELAFPLYLERVRYRYWESSSSIVPTWNSMMDM